MTMVETPTGATSPSAPDSRPAWRRPPVFPILLIWLALTALLTVFALFVPAQLMGEPASDRMREVQETMTWFTVASAPVAALVWAVLLYSLVKWRHRGSEMPVDYGPPMRRHQSLQIVWVVISTVLCLFLLIWGLILLAPVSAEVDTVSPPLIVNVTGQQWSWTFEYPASGGIQSENLYLPNNQRVVFHVTSKDVVHSFWIVPMAVKVDANPGAITTVEVTPDRLGVFPIRCAELCGLYHSEMQTTAHVVTTEEFGAWAKNQSVPPIDVPAPDSGAGTPVPSPAAS